MTVILIIVNISVEEGIISDVCIIILANYLILTIALSDFTTASSPTPPQFFNAPQAQTMLGAIIRIPQLISYGVNAVVPYAKQVSMLN